MRLVARLGLLLLLAACVPAAAMRINLIADANLIANTAALNAFDRAAYRWATLFSDPIDIYINAGLSTFADPMIIGSASSVLLQAGYDTIRDAMVADAASDPNNAVVGYLPTAAQFSAYVPTGVSLNGYIAGTKANLKALGFTGLDGAFGQRDATITFNSTFAFDYDNSNGVTAGQMDFETVATHEIGHALGFVSSVDRVDAGVTSISLAPLDLFRFSTAVGDNPTTYANFRTTPRYLDSGAAMFDDVDHEWQFSTGVNHGDGRQASHWKADEITGVYIGMLDPTLSSGTMQSITAADIRALDLIGYDYAAPEPSTVALLAGGLVLLFMRKRRRPVPR